MNTPDSSDCLAALTDRIIHIWPVRTRCSEEVAARFRSILSPEENDRASRFRFDHSVRSFVAARGTLRALLGRYLNMSPAGIRFGYVANGKPCLGFPIGTGIEFNVSHSDDMALFAFTQGCRIGVDVERIKPVPDKEAIASRFFCVEEAKELMSLAEHERERAFFVCWTRKEACVKAWGSGLSAALDSFRVTLRPGENARIIDLGQNPAVRQWTLAGLEFLGDYVAAVAYEDTLRSVRVMPVCEPAEFIANLHGS